MRRKVRIDDIAGRQHGVVTREQLLGIGWSPSRIDRAMRAGQLHRIHTGVHAVGHRALSDHGRWLAAVLACPTAAVLSHHSAAMLHGLPVSDNGLTRVSTARHVRRPGFDTHRAHLAPPERTVRHRIPVTSVARTLADLAHTLDEQSLHRTIREAQFKGLFEETNIQDALTRRPTRRLKDYLGDDTLTQSELEDAFLKLCRRHKIPTPQTQFGTNPRVDFIWHAERLIVEVDGWKAHRTRIAFQNDRTTTNALLLAGYLVLRYTHDDVTRRPRLVAAQVSAARGARR
jgi:very-short-patch-repair endonuclease